MLVACDEQGKPYCQLHGLRQLDPRIFTHIPYTSVDSTNVAQSINKDQRYDELYRTATPAARGIAIAERIEAFQSASKWTKQPLQDSFFHELTQGVGL